MAYNEWVKKSFKKPILLTNVYQPKEFKDYLRMLKENGSITWGLEAKRWVKT